MKPFLSLIIFFVIVSCGSNFTPCYFGVLSFEERARLSDSIRLAFDSLHETKTLTETENTARLNFFRSTIPIAEKLETIKNEIRARVSYAFPSKLIKVTDGREVISSAITCEILFIVTIRDESYLINFPEFSMTNKRLQLLNEKNIDSIRVLRGATATALYGTQGNCGVVILHSNTLKLKSEFDKL